jgi:tocopherol O-methyltransferase
VSQAQKVQKIDEHTVQQFYDSALHCYQQIMGDRWHHGDPEAENAGLPSLRACQILEERIVALSGLPVGGKAIDFGSGIGGPTCHMAKVSGASFVGVTNNERLNQTARAKAAQIGLGEKVTFLTLEDTGYKNLPFAEGTFDAATFFESVCHVPDKAALFRELARVLKRGGRVAGTDWVQRPFGPYQTEEQIMKFMEPVNEHIAIPWHGTVGDYKKLMEEAGLRVAVARDLFPGIECWGSTPDSERSEWINYEGPEAEMFRKGKQALDDARKAGVFSVGMWVAVKP